MSGQKVDLSLDMFVLILLALIKQSFAIKTHYYKVEKDEGVSNLSMLKKIAVFSELDCVSRCEQNDKCFLATYRKSTNDCYMQINGCTVQETVRDIGWVVFHKTDSCFQSCKQAPRYNWWQSFCAGTINGLAYCTPDQDLLILPSVYGSVACPIIGKLTAFPSCGKYVTDQIAALCNDRLNCTLNANSAMFGTTNCGGGEHLYVEYMCQTNDAKCHNICQAIC